MKKPYLIVVAFAAVAVSAYPALAATDAAGFVRNASIGNMFEMESSRIAREKASTNQLREFAGDMLADHGMTDRKLKDTLKKANLDIQPPTQLDSKHQDMLDALKAASKGKEFDAKYAEFQMAAHDEAVSLFSDYAASGDNGTLKAFASDTLPTLQEHKKEIYNIASK